MATIIIPCAGDGSRLGLPFSKELMPLAEGKAALSSVMDKALQHSEVSRVVVVVRTGKSDIVDHLGRYAATDKVVMVHQYPTARDAAGAALSALHLVDEKCVLLLPDHILSPQANQDPLSDLLATLDSVPVAFLAAPIAQVGWAEEAGVLQTSAVAGKPFRKVIGYTEHPAEAMTYDAVWAAAGFQRAAARPALKAMARAKTEPPTGSSLGILRHVGILGAAAVMLESFLDIGDWVRYADHWRR